MPPDKALSMLDAATTRPGFYDLLRIEDPDFQRSEAICLAVAAVIELSDDHTVVRASALANLLIAFLVTAPASHRIPLTDSLLNDIREKVRRSLCADA